MILSDRRCNAAPMPKAPLRIFVICT
jgi:hypothetical protein